MGTRVDINCVGDIIFGVVVVVVLVRLYVLVCVSVCVCVCSKEWLRNDNMSRCGRQFPGLLVQGS